MQVTVDIPEALYHELEDRALASRQSIGDALLERAFGISAGTSSAVLRSSPFLPIPQGEGASVDLSQNLNEAFFDDFDPS